MRNSEKLQQETESTLEEVETFLHDLSFVDLPGQFLVRGRKLESKVKLLRAKAHLHLHRAPLSSLRHLHDPFPKDLDLKRPRSSTSPEHLFSFLPDVPEEEEQSVAVTSSSDDSVILDQNDNDICPMTRPRSASFPLSL